MADADGVGGECRREGHARPELDRPRRGGRRRGGVSRQPARLLLQALLIKGFRQQPIQLARLILGELIILLLTVMVMVQTHIEAALRFHCCNAFAVVNQAQGSELLVDRRQQRVRRLRLAIVVRDLHGEEVGIVL